MTWASTPINIQDLQLYNYEQHLTRVLWKVNPQLSLLETRGHGTLLQRSCLQLPGFSQWLGSKTPLFHSVSSGMLFTSPLGWYCRDSNKTHTNNAMANAPFLPHRLRLPGQHSSCPAALPRATERSPSPLRGRTVGALLV